MIYVNFIILILGTIILDLCDDKVLVHVIIVHTVNGIINGEMD